MGINRMGPPEELISSLISQFNINIFVETGTYYGGTAIWASKNFKQVITIEYSQELYESVKKQYQNVKNIEFLWGDSRTKLKDLIPSLKNPALFWLDAHYSGGLTYGEEDQCPIIEEINIINASGLDHFLLLDDARLFLSPPQPPHNIQQWPNISELVDALREKVPDKYIVIIEDVIIAVPRYAKPVVAAYCQDVNAQAWEEYGKSNLQKGINLIKSDVGFRIKSLAAKIKAKLIKPD